MIAEIATEDMAGEHFCKRAVCWGKVCKFGSGMVHIIEATTTSSTTYLVYNVIHTAGGKQLKNRKRLKRKENFREKIPRAPYFLRGVSSSLILRIGQGLAQLEQPQVGQ